MVLGTLDENSSLVAVHMRRADPEFAALVRISRYALDRFD
jgi:hypothetical protein